MTLYTDELQKAYQAGVNSVLISQTNLNQPGESGPYQDKTTYPKETEGQKLEKEGGYIDSGDPITDDNIGPDGRPLESRMFDIDPKKHKTQQKQGKIRNLADQGTTEGEKKAAKGKLKDQTDLPNFLQNINIKPQDLLKILQLLPALGGFQLQNAKVTPGPAPVWPGHKWPDTPTPGQGPLPNPNIPTKLAMAPGALDALRRGTQPGLSSQEIRDLLKPFTRNDQFGNPSGSLRV